MAGSFFKGRDERYKLDGDVVLVIDGAARDDLLAATVPYCHQAADSIESAANAASTWGGYKSYHHDSGAAVAAFNASDGERGRRLLAALQQGAI